MYLLTSAYLAPIHYYTKLYSGRPVVEERCEHYVKQTYRNRCLIATTHGVQALTLPVEGRPIEEGGTSKTPTRDIRLSNHGRWRELHWNALRTAYESTPYFDYYAEDFERIYRGEQTFLVDFNEELQQTVLSLLSLQVDWRCNTEHYIEQQEETPDFIDLRERIRPKIAFDFDPEFIPKPYYQVFASKLGFLPNLSIIDLLFNMGPESRLVLRDSYRRR